jgi:hypothetical protein
VSHTHGSGKVGIRETHTTVGVHVGPIKSITRVRPGKNAIRMCVLLSLFFLLFFCFFLLLSFLFCVVYIIILLLFFSSISNLPERKL